MFNSINNFTTWFKDKKKKTIKTRLIRLCKYVPTAIISTLAFLYLWNHIPSQLHLLTVLFALAAVSLALIAFFFITFTIGQTEFLIKALFSYLQKEDFKELLPNDMNSVNWYEKENIDAILNFLLTLLIEKKQVLDRKSTLDLEKIQIIEGNLLYNQTLLEEYHNEKMPNQINLRYTKNQDFIASELSLILSEVKFKKLNQSNFKEQLENVSQVEKLNYLIDELNKKREQDKEKQKNKNKLEESMYHKLAQLSQKTYEKSTINTLVKPEDLALLKKENQKKHDKKLAL